MEQKDQTENAAGNKGETSAHRERGGAVRSLKVSEPTAGQDAGFAGEAIRASEISTVAQRDTEAINNTIKEKNNQVIGMEKTKSADNTDATAELEFAAQNKADLDHRAQPPEHSKSVKKKIASDLLKNWKGSNNDIGNKAAQTPAPQFARLPKRKRTETGAAKSNSEAHFPDTAELR